jgi:hypothetical protein
MVFQLLDLNFCEKSLCTAAESALRALLFIDSEWPEGLCLVGLLRLKLAHSPTFVCM